jgi:hypothetical protein
MTPLRERQRDRAMCRCQLSVFRATNFFSARRRRLIARHRQRERKEKTAERTKRQREREGEKTSHTVLSIFSSIVVLRVGYVCMFVIGEEVDIDKDENERHIGSNPIVSKGDRSAFRSFSWHVDAITNRTFLSDMSIAMNAQQNEPILLLWGLSK